jgi:DNA polymerase III sliding clamp (beta) subunit (PCNA family)
MKVDRKALVKAIAAIQPGLATGTADAAARVYFREDVIMASSGEVFVFYPFEHDLDGAVRGVELYKLLNKMPDKEVIVTHKKSKKEVGLEVKGLQTTAFFKEEEALEIGDPPKPKNWEELPDDFTQGLNASRFSVSKDERKFPFNCLLVKEEYIYACDGYRATRWEMEDEAIEEKELLIPGQLVKDMALYEPTEYAEKNGWQCFRNENGAIFAFRTLEAEYPDIDFLFDVEGIEVEIPKGFENALTRAQILTEDLSDSGNDDVVELTVKKGEISCKGTGTAGYVTEKAKVKYKGKEFTILVNATLLKEIIKQLRIMTVGDKGLLFEGDDFDHAISLAVAS